MYHLQLGVCNVHCTFAQIIMWNLCLGNCVVFNVLCVICGVQCALYRAWCAVSAAQSADLEATLCVPDRPHGEDPDTGVEADPGQEDVWQESRNTGSHEDRPDDGSLGDTLVLQVGAASADDSLP